jgi:hypothetical protein
VLVLEQHGRRPAPQTLTGAPSTVSRAPSGSVGATATVIVTGRIRAGIVELRILKLRWGTVLAVLELPPADGGEGLRSCGEASVRMRSPRARSTICQGNGGCHVFSRPQVSRLCTEIDVKVHETGR